MKNSGNTWRRWITLALLTAPLLQMSCVEIAQRALINGFFDAATPVALERITEQINDFFANWSI